MRLLHRWADTQLRAENERLRGQRSRLIESCRRIYGRLESAQEEAARWRSIALDRAAEMAEMKKEQNQ